MSRYWALAGFIALTLGGGTLVGLVSVPGEWYAGLAKPWFNPPNWVFGPAWTVLYVLIAIAGWRIWLLPQRGAAMMLWWLQLALNFAWTPIFFLAHQLGLALVVVCLILLLSLGFVATAWHKDRPAALLFVPYVLWTAFASLLNASVWWLN
ncbi:MAG: tryptophan-rich sensory protein [Rhizobiaceae bacterium]|nr:tryptophan-rich sensory protein [Rhizobiaceae bacterium]